MNYRFWKYNHECVVFTNETGAARLRLTDKDMITPPNAQEVAGIFHRLLPGRTVYVHRDYLEVEAARWPTVVTPQYCALCRDRLDGEGPCVHKRALREVTA